IKPAAQKKALGTSEPGRDRDRVENFIEPVDGLPLPKNFSGALREKWEWVTARLKEHRVLTVADADIGRVYCENWAIYEEAVANVFENGATLWVHTAHGKKPMSNPSFRHMKEAEIVLRQIWAEFGFSPRARMGLKVQDKTPAKSAILEAMNGGLKKAQ
ncbi:MAG: phage terminase small subunit P27 family, partial [Saprospiraceae bacterium]